MKVVFMGTPDFSVPVLQALIESEHEVAAVVTQPDKPKGRGKEMQPTPVKAAALAAGITVYQPVKVREPEFVQVLMELQPDVIVVVAFGQILPKSILELPQYGCVNVHASLLPKYRGAAPIQWAVIQGEKKTGVTTMYMAEGIDTGDMLFKEEVLLDEKETYGSLHDKLAALGGGIILRTLKALEDGTAVRTAQKEEDSSHVGMIQKSMGKIDFTMEAEQIERLIRGLNPWPSAFTFYGKKSIKIWDADVEDQNYSEKYGEIVKVDKDSFTVQTGKGALVIRELQLEGKKRMDTAAFLRGVPLEKGVILG